MNTAGELPQKGSMAPDFKAVKNDLSEIKLSDLKGKRVVINIFPSIDTGVCAASVRRFNKEASELKNTVVLCLSQDLPFAQARFCGAEGLTNVVTVSTFRNPEFNQGYGMLLKDGPMAGLMARSVVVLDEEGKVVYTELVSEVTNEPNYEAALACLK
ncbi:Thiol peroxidase [Porphyromonas macacae]|uniref:Thiol peroxidase n=2 Tax=Porphyromonas macacae TaxID=28115 RepID=A0A379DK46_9PORP|nr:Thiol peroxidase [Porphyromonas macacae]SUB89952.1 Thiol peroxidase [Porphyromonas macacae]